MINCFRLAGLVITLFLSLQRHPLMSQTPTDARLKDAKMECTLLVQKTVPVGETPQAEVEIKNTAKQDLTITYNAFVWEFLDLEVIDPAGKKVSYTKYSGLFSPATPTPEQTLVLKPGETYRHTVGVFGTTRKADCMTPGVYRITATFEYDKVRAVAKTVELTLTAK